MKKIKTVFGALIILFSFTHLAQASERSVTSLNMGECWVGKPEANGPLKLVHFASESAWQVYPYHYQDALDEIKAEVASFGLLEGKLYVETLIHCASSKSSLVFNLRTQNSRVCVWADLKNNELQINRLGVEPKNFDGQCTGARPGELILSVGDFYSQEKLIAQLSELGLWSNTSSLRSVTKDVLVLSLSRDFWFKEEKIINMILNEASMKGVIKSAELNFYPHSSGEFMLLDELSGEL